MPSRRRVRDIAAHEAPKWALEVMMAVTKKTGAKQLVKAGGGQSLAKVAAAALAQIAAIRKSLDTVELASLTVDERKHSNGRFRDGEEVAVTAIFDTVDAHPAHFQALAAHDHGVDDAVLETGPARDAVARRNVFAPLADELAALAARVSDDVLASGALAKDVSGPAYAIIRANAKLDKKLRASASKALDFYAKAAKRKAPAKPAVG